MPKPDIDKQKLEKGGMFDFLDEEAANSPARPMHKAATESAMPIIRKPVPISESGPIKVEQGDSSDDFSFLDSDSVSATSASASTEFSEEWNDGVSHGAAQRTQGINTRWIVAGIAGFLLLAAASVFVFSLSGGQDDNQLSAQNEVASAHAPETPTQGIPQTAPLSQRFNEQLEQLNKLVTQGELDKAESLLLNMDKTVYGYGAPEFSAIEIEIAQMRSDVGINATPAQEQPRAALEQQAAAQKQAALEQQAAAQKQAALEQQAAAQKQAALEQQAAAQKQAALEQQAAAQKQAALEQQAAAQKQAALEQQAAAKQQAELAEQIAAQRQIAIEKQAAEIEAKAAALQQKEAERIAAEAVAAQRRNAAVAAEQKAANDALIAKQNETKALDDARALAQKRARDRQIALVAEQRKQQEAQKAAEASDLRAQKANEAKANLQITPAVVQQPTVTDDDLQLVYSKFLALRDAVKAKDINKVISLTSRNEQWVQQLLQLFENSESIESRISNVATRNAEATIVGSLKILSVVRRDGSSVAPPEILSNIVLTSKRGPDGWSVISW